MAEVTLTTQNFEEEVIKSQIPVLVDFWATWCGPCMMLAPILEEIATEYEGKVTVGKVNVDEQMKIAQQYGIANIPTMILFKEGHAVNVEVGYMPKEKIKTMLDGYIA